MKALDYFRTTMKEFQHAPMQYDRDIAEIIECIAELEALQSRSCEGCKYCGGEAKQSFCVLRLMPAHMYEFEFCCNRYEAKPLS